MNNKTENKPMSKALVTLLERHAESHGYTTVINPVNNNMLLVINRGKGKQLYRVNTLKQLYIAMGY